MSREAKYVIRLTEEERSMLQDLLGKPRVAAAKVLRARMVLKADVDGPGWSDPKIGEAFDVGLSTIHRLRQRLVEEGLEATLARRPSTQQRVPKLDGAKEARLIAIACSSPPEGRARWTLKLLADQLVELDIVDDISSETVRQTLKKTHSSRGGSSSG
jgi:transposase